MRKPKIGLYGHKNNEHMLEVVCIDELGIVIETEVRRYNVDLRIVKHLNENYTYLGEV